jgi:hypothetical protein
LPSLECLEATTSMCTPSRHRLLGRHRPRLR